MSPFELLQSVILGLVEGLTEFLPISSTGHLIIAGRLLHFDSAQAATFDIVIQLGAILAVCWHYRQRLGLVLVTLGSRSDSRRFVLHLVLAMLPAAIIGLLLHHFIKLYLFNPLTVSLALILGGCIMLFIERGERPVRIGTVEQLDWQDALKLGCAQAVALLPGVSRSGATIMGGLLFGLSRQAATEFSFFLAIPTMFAATGFDLLQSWHALSQEALLFIAVGFMVSFVSALVAIRALLWYVGHHNFRAFAWYRILFGMLVLLFFTYIA